MLRLSAVGPYGSLSHLPLDVAADAGSFCHGKVDLIKQVWEASLIVVHDVVNSKRRAC